MRREYKFYLSEQYLDEFRKDITPYILRDEHLKSSKLPEYLVQSIYFDTPAFSTYTEKLAGIKKRMKFRIRVYNQPEPDSSAFIEIKRKDTDFISKDRALIPVKNISLFLKTANLELLHSTAETKKQNETSAVNFLYYYNLLHLRPTVQVNYSREAYFCGIHSGLRLTLDKYLATGQTSHESVFLPGHKLTPTLPGYFILEVKFLDSLPGWLGRVLAKYGVMRKAASKYAMGVEHVNSTILNY